MRLPCHCTPGVTLLFTCGAVGAPLAHLCTFQCPPASDLSSVPRWVSQGNEQPLVVGIASVCITFNSVFANLFEWMCGLVCKSTPCPSVLGTVHLCCGSVTVCPSVMCVSEQGACACWVCVRKRTGESRQGQGGRCTQRPWCSSKAKEIRFQESLELGLEGDRRWASLPAFPGRQHKAGLKNILPFRSLFIILN